MGIAEGGPCLLALSTVQRTTGIALVQDGEADLVWEEERVGRRSEFLLKTIDDLLRERKITMRDLDAVAVCTGPGTFTGIRVGMAAARGLAFAASLPLVGVTAFEAYARQWSPEGTLVVALDARRGEVYSQVFGEAEGIGLMHPERLVERMVANPRWVPINLNGDAVGLYEASWKRVPNLVMAPEKERGISVASVAAVGVQKFTTQKKGMNPFEVQPFYVRRSDKELQLGC